MMKKWLVAGTLWMMAALLAGCASTSWGHCKTQREDDRETEATLCTDRYQYKFGETVHIRFTVTNTSRERLVLEPPEGGPAMDIEVGGGLRDVVVGGARVGAGVDAAGAGARRESHHRMGGSPPRTGTLRGRWMLA